ncbi:hypothetical protein BCD64_27355 [Nostoc sp. MBR 210]|nr:hypothetical protein BCD64_27355 [Nostoc sp. MBR 210]
MSFPEHDSYWMDTVNFIQQHYCPEDFVLAPEIFWEKFTRLYTYKITHSQRAIAADCHWAIIHKGLLAEIEESYLQALLKEFSPVFANAVFVVFSRSANLPTLPDDDLHWMAFKNWLRQNKQWPHRFQKLKHRLKGYLRRWFSRQPPQRTTGIPEKMEKIVDFKTLTDEQIRQEMNQLYLEGGYEFPTFYDQARSTEIDQYTLEMLPATAGRKILDIGCGIGRGASLIKDCELMVGIDLSDVAIEQAQRLYANQSNCQFLQMNALQLDFPDHNFDMVLSLEMIEHVSNAQQYLREALRVLKPGGCFLFNVANQDSLHLRITRALGYPAFKTNYQHFQEFSLAEIEAMLLEAGGKIQAIRGSFLIPYWGVPGVSEAIRHLTDNQPEVVNILQTLGHQVSPEYAYTFFVACTKV